LGIVLIALNAARCILVGLFCWASLLEKASFDWQEEVIRSHRNIPYNLVIARNEVTKQSPTMEEIASLPAVARNDGNEKD